MSVTKAKWFPHICYTWNTKYSGIFIFFFLQLLIIPETEMECVRT